MNARILCAYDDSAAADILGVDHIVIGHRGKSRIERRLVGSISKRIIAYATCSVTIVR